jgi:hypothetical protein
MVAKLDVDVDKFWRDGFLILRRLFSPAEFKTMRDQVFASLEGREKRGDPVVDALADPYLKYWVHDERLVTVAKAILQSERLAYFGDGGYAVLGHKYEAGVDVGGWHRDNTDRSSTDAPDWQGRYSLIRFGLYLQDHRRQSGGLIVRRTSHDQILKGLSAHRYDRYLNTGIGDVGVWSMRIQHAGLGRCIRYMPGLALGPYLQRKLPEFLQAPFPREERTGFWISYAHPDHHLERHCQYLLTRSERLEMWQHAYYTEDTLKQCQRAGLEVVDMPTRMREALASGEQVGQHKHHHAMAH